MDGFQKALESLQAADIAFLVPDPAPHQSARNKRNRRKSSGGQDAVASIPEPGAANVARSIPVATIPHPTVTPSVPASPPFGEHPLPAFALASNSPAVADAAPTTGAAKTSRTRQHVEHEWPPVGTILAGTYYGTVYRAEVVVADKRLKSGKQLVLLDGPAKGQRFDSLTRALLAATVKQRETMKLGRSGATNGWEFWAPEKVKSSPAA